MKIPGGTQMWFRKNSSSELNDELQFHLEKEIAQNVARGMPAAEARRQALITFGGVQQTRENVRQVRWTYLAEILAQDLRYALRMLRKSPGFTAVAVLTLALGIGMNSAIFSLIDAVLFRSLPADRQEELVLLRWHAHSRGKVHSHSSYGDCPNQRLKENPNGCSFSLPFQKMLETKNTVFSGLAAFSGAPQLDLSGNGAASIVNSGQLVSGNFFATLGVQAALGRTLGPSDNAPNAAPVMVLSYGYWQNAFGGSPDTVGRVVKLNGQPFTIVGVAEPRFEGLSPGRRIDLWLPLSVRAGLMPRWTPEEDDAGSWWIVILARLKPGVSAAQAQAAASLLYRDETLHEQKPIFADADAPGIDLTPAQQGLQGGRSSILQPLYLLMMVVAVVLLIACTNIAGLLLARATARRKEIAVRLTLGARRGRLIAQLTVESLVLSVLGGTLGLFFATWGARGLLLMTDRDGTGALPFTPHLDLRVLAFTAAIAIVTGVIFGLAPALRSLRVDLTPALKTGGGASEAGAHRTRWYGLGNLLVVAQVSLAIVALVTAGLLVRTLSNLKNVELGFDSNNVLVFGLNPSLAGYKGTQIDSLYRDLQEQFAALPGVASVSYSSAALLSGRLWDMDFHMPGTPETQASESNYMQVGPQFFATMRIPLQAGRDLSGADFAASAARASLPPSAPPDPHAAPVTVVVNQAFVRRYFPHANPLGQHVEAMLPEDASRPRASGWEIVGVVGDARYESLRGDIKPTMYAANAGNAFFSVRTSSDPEALVPAIRDLVNRRNSNLAMYRIATEEQQIQQQVFVERLVARLSSFFGLLALLLACTGVYGLLSYEVTRRTREIGIRMAVGAQQKDVTAMVVRHGLLLALAGAVVGASASFAVNGLMQSILYRVHAGDPLTLAAVTAILVVVALAACYQPARRATRVDPLVALRHE
jgi:predicted permease